MRDFRDPGVQWEKWSITYCAQYAKCSTCPLTVERFDPASPRRFEIVDLAVGVRCGSALEIDSPSTALYCPLCWRFRTFEMGILAMWMMENVRHLPGHLFLEELSSCRKCYGIYRRRERSRSREVCQPSLLFSLLSPGWRSEMQSEYIEKQDDANGKLESDIQCTFC